MGYGWRMLSSRGILVLGMAGWLSFVMACNEPKHADGESCIQASQCESNYCQAGKCAREVTLGGTAGTTGYPADAEAEETSAEAATDATSEDAVAEDTSAPEAGDDGATSDAESDSAEADAPEQEAAAGDASDQ